MIKIIIDSSTDFPCKTSSVYLKNFILLPLKISFGFNTYEDKIDLTSIDFYKMLQSNNDFPKTSQVTLNDFQFIMTKILKDKNNEIIVITLSSTLSGTYNTALKTKEIIKSDRIHIIDGTASITNGILAIYAYKLTKTIKSTKKIVDLIKKKRDSQNSIFTIDSFEYLKKGGRISNIQFIIGGMFNIKPILGLNKENRILKIIDKAKGEKQLFKKILENINKNNKKEPIIIAYSGEESFKRGCNLKKYIENNSRKKVNSFAQIGALIGSHLGPSVLGVYF